MYLDKALLDLDTTSVKVAGERGVTLNGTGYIFYNLSPLAKEFISNEAKPDRTVFEIGSGFSNIPLQCLKNGVGKYLASDLSSEHLSLLVRRIKDECGEEADGMIERLNRP